MIAVRCCLVGNFVRASIGGMARNAANAPSRIPRYPVTAGSRRRALTGLSSRVIQTFKAEGILETRRGAILVKNADALRSRSCLCNEAVKNHFEEVLRGVYPDPKKAN